MSACPRSLSQHTHTRTPHDREAGKVVNLTISVSRSVETAPTICLRGVPPPACLTKRALPVPRRVPEGKPIPGFEAKAMASGCSRGWRRGCGRCKFVIGTGSEA